jgi:hypothetical protein
MSNWRDRTERDATLSHRRINPDSINIKLDQISDNKIPSKSWRYAIVISTILLSTSLFLLISLLFQHKITIVGNDTHTNSKNTDKAIVVAICEKDDKGNSVTNIVGIDGANKRPFIEWNSETVCKEVSTELNKQINADRKKKLDTTSKAELEDPQPSSVDPDEMLSSDSIQAKGLQSYFQDRWHSGHNFDGILLYTVNVGKNGRILSLNGIDNRSKAYLDKTVFLKPGEVVSKNAQRDQKIWLFLTSAGNVQTWDAGE